MNVNPGDRDHVFLVWPCDCCRTILLAQSLYLKPEWLCDLWHRSRVKHAPSEIFITRLMITGQWLLRQCAYPSCTFTFYVRFTHQSKAHLYYIYSTGYRLRFQIVTRMCCPNYIQCTYLVILIDYIVFVRCRQVDRSERLNYHIYMTYYFEFN